MLSESQVLVVLPESEWLDIKKKLEEISELIINRNAEERNSEWIDSAKATQVLGVG